MIDSNVFVYAVYLGIYIAIMIGIADLFEKTAIEIGLNIIGHDSLDRTKSDFTEELRN